VSEVLVEPEGIDWDQEPNPSPESELPSPNTKTKTDAEGDPLLELFRTGSSLSKSQLLLELEKHQLAVTPGEALDLNRTESFAYQRREPRIAVDVPVQIRSHENQPHENQELPAPSSQTTHLIDVSHRGARVGGLSFHLKAGEVVNLVSDGCDARFLVIWVGEPGTSQEGQIGLQSLATD
jgi:hypothetical protein